MSYELTAASMRLADLVPSRPPDEVINQLFAKGTVSHYAGSDFNVDTELTSPSGNLANVPYQNLNLQTSVAGKIARVTLLRVKAFSGAIVATGNTRLEPAAPMEASISFTNIDVHQALDSQKSKAAGTVRGALGGNIAVSGKIGKFDEMKPTLKGSGQLTLVNGKLVGVNVAARR